MDEGMVKRREYRVTTQYPGSVQSTFLAAPASRWDAHDHDSFVAVNEQTNNGSLHIFDDNHFA